MNPQTGVYKQSDIYINQITAGLGINVSEIRIQLEIQSRRVMFNSNEILFFFFILMLRNPISQ